ncbi:unnamed protein product [Rodentolepis nana]|uniref:Uncharacterized protein n=1 Tax=Rodentolepis nana TaxID=102285 RepID=A0A0R3TL49_RODNA|nr:unnamed protein product [Rodentolepis nana]
MRFSLCRRHQSESEAILKISNSTPRTNIDVLGGECFRFNHILMTNGGFPIQMSCTYVEQGISCGFKHHGAIDAIWRKRDSCIFPPLNVLMYVRFYKREEFITIVVCESNVLDED